LGHHIELRSVSVDIRDNRRILGTIELRVSTGEKLAVVGPNGAGKSTLLQVMAGIRRPSSGRVLIGGRDLVALAPIERARAVAFVSQGDHPDLRLTLEDYVDLGRVPHRASVNAPRHREIVAAAIAEVGLSAFRTRTLSTLSGGERQRAAIARALAQEPTILILDEPTNHLDPRARADLIDLAHRLEITVIAALHDLPLVDRFADRVAVLSRGQLVAVDHPAKALSPRIVGDIFAMDCFPTINPVTGRALTVFDTPKSAATASLERIR
jgi:iron complex transport system ATP-binding protein